MSPIVCSPVAPSIACCCARTTRICGSAAPEGSWVWIDAVADELRAGEADCVYLSGLPLGAAATGLTRAALMRVLELKDEEDTEVWSGYFIGSGRFVSKEISLADPLLNHPEIRLTLDYAEDFDLIDAIFAELGIGFSSVEVMDLLINRRPELVRLNRSARARYERHLATATPVRFKDAPAP